jgi:hypothetical protein
MPGRLTLAPRARELVELANAVARENQQAARVVATEAGRPSLPSRPNPPERFATPNPVNGRRLEALLRGPGEMIFESLVAISKEAPGEFLTLSLGEHLILIKVISESEEVPEDPFANGSEETALLPPQIPVPGRPR